MATDYAAMEREFLAGLESDTGLDLAGWMDLIDAQQLPHRNAIIDWLRTEGFLFSWASWLERIHHNGGRPIYASIPVGAPPSVGPPAGEAAPPTPSVAPPALRAKEGAATTTAASLAEASSRATGATRAEAVGPLAAAAAVSITDLLARAKAYRPLAEHLLREVRKALPDVIILPRAGGLSLARPKDFAALAISGKELRLGLDLGEDAVAEGLTRGRLAISEVRMTHVLALTDARQITPALLDALKRACRNVNGE